MLKTEGEIKKSYLHRRISSRSGELPKAVSWLKKKGFVISRIKRVKMGKSPEMLDITEEGACALEAYYT